MPTQGSYNIYHPDNKNLTKQSDNQKTYMGEIEFGLKPNMLNSFDPKKNNPSHLTE